MYVNCTVIDASTVSCNGTDYLVEVPPLGPDEPQFWIYIGIYIGLMLFAGLVAGLTLGLLSLDITTLQVLSTAGTPSEQVYATRILPLVKNSHLLLVTLILANAAAVESMPIFLDHVTNPIVAVAVSVTAVLIFGEVIPQSICSKYGLAIGANMAWFVYILIALTFVISWPIAKLLTLLLGEGIGTFYRRSELKALVDIQATSPEAAAEDSALTKDEVLIIKGALDAEGKVAKDAMIPLDDTFMLDYYGVLDRTIMQQLIANGYSHVPVYKDDRKNIQGAFVVKNLIILDPDDNESISTSLEQYGRPLHSIAATKPLYNILDEMMDGKYRMAAIYDNPAILPILPTIDEADGNVPSTPTLPTTTSQTGLNIIGVITLWNVLEVVLGEPIISSDDVYASVRQKVEMGKVKMVRSLSANPMGTTASHFGSINSPPSPALTPQPSTAENTPLLSPDNFF
ncbi:DUF21 domain-containing protein At2g14520 [Strongylocentrotus purpuratus]|uniref:CNNM transmembrane domain-containing protein n=1 Tax=Strongylocentrotus purpuratus TaxID=7668 RepID=A0A7M7PIU3_STRPU|nr:DUF21 domain-containing protein At2g14520 [Strongylocentrotus purpuratus]XP_030850902.1 DUF21 domain-containing protein At2g14520 [Strongylocentrotus purpuratus]